METGKKEVFFLFYFLMKLPEFRGTLSLCNQFIKYLLQEKCQQSAVSYNHCMWLTSTWSHNVQSGTETMFPWIYLLHSSRQEMKRLKTNSSSTWVSKSQEKWRNQMRNSGVLLKELVSRVKTRLFSQLLRTLQYKRDIFILHHVLNQVDFIRAFRLESRTPRF